MISYTREHTASTRERTMHEIIEPSLAAAVQSHANELYGDGLPGHDYDTDEQRLFALVCDATRAYVAASLGADATQADANQAITWALEAVSENVVTEPPCPDDDPCSCMRPVPQGYWTTPGWPENDLAPRARYTS